MTAKMQKTWQEKPEEMNLPKPIPLEWLLEEENPTVRYLTLTEILDRDRDSAEAQAAKEEIMRTGLVPKILGRQNPGGYWEKAEDFYIRTKYRGTVWTLILLAELGAAGSDERVKKACEFILERSQERESGGFSYLGSKKRGGQHSAVLPCLTGNMVWSLIRFGYASDPRVRSAVEWIGTYQRFDDGALRAPGGWPYSRYQSCWGKHSCHLGVVKALKALAEIPVGERTKGVEQVIERGAEYLLRHHLYKRSHNLDRVAKPKWLKLSFPWMANTDVLEMALILSRLGYRDERMKEALDLIVSKQDKQGRWPLEETYSGRLQVAVERKGKPSKWVTLRACLVLKKQGRI